MEKYTVDREDKARRLQCPRGHSSVGPTNNHWHCVSCARYWENVSAEFDTIEDKKTGKRYSRDQVEFDSDVPGVNYA